MAGHNKWSKIKHKKAKEDAKKGKVFTRLGREIQVAAREGGPDPSYNAALRQAVDRAMAENMPNDNIDRAIQRGAGLLPGQEFEDIVYEGYGPEGVAVMAVCLTDNRNRAVGEVRHAFSKAGGSLGETGSVAWNFDRRGQVVVHAPEASEEAMMEAAIEAGADDVQPGDGETWNFLCADTELANVRGALKEAGHEVRDADLVFEPKATLPVEGGGAEKVLRFIAALEELDDVQAVYANFEIPDDELDRLAQAV